jgi:L-threonylcarbamoyladenylate synthase
VTPDEQVDAVGTLRAGGVVAAPTESFYGLLADARNPSSLDALFQVKPRTRGVALIMPWPEQWGEWVDAIPHSAQALSRRFWPGPLTIALPANDRVDCRLTVDGTVGVRVPVLCAALQLSRALGHAVTATSANLAGAPPAVTDADVRRDLGAHERAGLLRIVSGQSPGAAPSTVVVVQKGAIFVVRRGAIESSDIEAATSVPL